MAGRLSGDMLTLEVMAQYGWTYPQLKEQPTWVVELAKRKLEIEGKLRKAAQEEQARSTQH